MKKILIVTDSLRLGGLETVIVNYLKYSYKKNYQFTYLILNNKEDGELEEDVRQKGGEIVKLYPPKQNYFKFYFDLKKIMQYYGPFDVVHSHPAFTSGIVMRAAYKSNIPKRLSHSHTDKSKVKKSQLKSKYEIFMKRLLKKYSTKYLAVSNNAGNYLFGESFFMKNGTVLENGVDFNNYQYDVRVRNKVRKKYNLSNYTVIGHVGTFNKVKNQSFLIDILNNLLKYSDKYKLLLIGDGPTYDDLKKKAQKLKIKDKILFIGRRNDISQFLQAMDLFVFPSYYEGLGLSLLESQAAQLVTITSDMVPSEVLMTNYISVMPLSSSAEEWAEKIKSLKLNNRADLDKKPLIESDYQLEKSISKLHELYG